MPTYQYRCTECGHDLEAVQKFTDAALTECPNCSGPLRKIFNAVGVVFKGSGFYRTDSRAADKKGGGSAEKSDAGSSETSTGSDKKSEKKDVPATAGTGSGAAGSGGPSSGSGGKDAGSGSSGASSKPAAASTAGGS